MDKEFAEAFKEEIEKEASTYRDRTKDDEKKKKRHFAFGGKKDKKDMVLVDMVKVKK